MTQHSQSDTQRHATGNPVSLCPVSLWIAALVFCCGTFVMAGSLPAMADSLDQQQLVEKAQLTLENFADDPNLGWFQDHLKEARALLIIPQQLRGAFFVGADGGSGVLVVRDDLSGEWSQPAFYVMGGLSIGFQWGGEASEIILMVMTRGAVEKLYDSTFKLGADASIAAGPYGAGVEGAISENLNADFLSFSRSKGVYAGVSFEGSVIAADDTANEAYYGEKVQPVDIVAGRSVTNDHSSSLRRAVTAATKE